MNSNQCDFYYFSVSEILLFLYNSSDAPVMDQTPSTEVITWLGNPANITCVAQSIPNATIQWWYRGRMINSEENGFKIYGNGPVSVLNIKEPKQEFYEAYLCKAQNMIGENEIRIQLKEVCEFDLALSFLLNCSLVKSESIVSIKLADLCRPWS